MAKPRLIILIRHGQSEGNKNREIHQTVPDHRVKLTPEGWDQAHEAGRRLRQLLRPDDTIQFFTSPYRRTRETTEGILSTLTSDDLEPSPYRRPHIKVYEEPRLREQDFGNFQPCSAEMERMWQERADYGHFFYRIPNGESAADAYDRISGFNESLWRQFGDDDFPSVCVLVTHGLMSRVFLMKWYHFTVEYFEDLRNINHCEFLLMRKQGDGKYLLENKLRTWSEMRRERYAAAVATTPTTNTTPTSITTTTTFTKDGKEKSKDHVKLDKNKSFISTRRWGGCPNGCNHTAHYKRRHDLDALRDGKDGNPPPLHRINHNSSDEEDVESKHLARAIKPPPATQNDQGDEDDALILNGIPSSSDFGKNTHHRHLGRDFGGTYSGRASIASGDGSGSGSGSGSASEGENTRRRRKSAAAAAPTLATTTTHHKDPDPDPDGHHHHHHRTHANAERLGDEPATDADSDCGTVDEDLDKAEEEDKSIRGSVY